MLTSGHVTNYQYYISIITIIMVTRLIRVMTYCKKLPPINSQDPQLGGQLRSCDELNTLYCHLQKINGHQTRQSVDLQWEAPIKSPDPVIMWSWGHLTISENLLMRIGPASKRLSCHQLLVIFVPYRDKDEMRKRVTYFSTSKCV